MPDKIAMRLGALILTGGRSTRMGRPKESLLFSGETLLARTTATLQRCAEPVVIVARGAGQELPALPADTLRIADEQPGGGPLPALATGLRFLRTQDGCGDRTPVFATACDLPFLSVDLVQFLLARLGDGQLVLPRIGGFLQPLCAVWRADVLGTIDALVQRGERMLRALASAVPTRIVDETELREVDPTLRAFTNVNSPEDYARALAEGNR